MNLTHAYSIDKYFAKISYLRGVEISFSILRRGRSGVSPRAYPWHLDGNVVLTRDRVGRDGKRNNLPEERRFGRLPRHCPLSALRKSISPRGTHGGTLSAPSNCRKFGRNASSPWGKNGSAMGEGRLCWLTVAADKLEDSPSHSNEQFRNALEIPPSGFLRAGCAFPENDNLHCRKQFPVSFRFLLIDLTLFAFTANRPEGAEILDGSVRVSPLTFPVKFFHAVSPQIFWVDDHYFRQISLFLLNAKNISIRLPENYDLPLRIMLSSVGEIRFEKRFWLLSGLWSALRAIDLDISTLADLLGPPKILKWNNSPAEI